MCLLCLSACLHVHQYSLFVYQSNWLSICLSLCLYVLFLHAYSIVVDPKLSVCPSINLVVCLSISFLFVRLPAFGSWSDVYPDREAQTDLQHAVTAGTTPTRRSSRASSTGLIRQQRRRWQQLPHLLRQLATSMLKHIFKYFRIFLHWNYQYETSIIVRTFTRMIVSTKIKRVALCIT